MCNKTLKYLILLLALWAMVGCATVNSHYGSIVPDQAAERDFDAFRIDPQMNYYYSGGDLYPNALIGLKKEYVLDNDLWKPLEPSPRIFRDKIQSMKEKARSCGGHQYGFAIRDPQGKLLGIWYSMITVQTMTVRMGEGNKVIVYTPELDVYQERGGGGGDAGEASS